MGVQDLWLIIIVLVFCFQARGLNSQSLTCNQNDLKALEDFMRELEQVIDGWGTNISSNCCGWKGITCKSSSSLGLSNVPDTNRVVKLELGKMRLAGKLSESIGSLDQLRTLNLSTNFLKSSLPSSLFHLPNLEVLDLSNNDFYGPVPDTNLPSIIDLVISENSLNGSLPDGICGNSSAIKLLNLAVNYISGNLPDGLRNCSSLEYLYLGTNNLTGGITESILQLQKLTELKLEDNKLSGLLNEGIGNLTNLVRLDISTNMFSGTIPDVIRNTGKLQFFVAHSNRFNGTIPSSLTNCPTLTLLNVRNNTLEGPININCSVMVNLTSIDLGSNRFSGSIPDNLPSCQSLNNINLARNHFIGPIPESFKNFRSLSYLSLSNSSNTNLSSSLRVLQQCRNLTTLVFSLNFHDEELPADPTLHFDKLKVLIIANCRLKGSIPQWLSNSKQLQLLDLSWNCLGGPVPAWFGNFGSLFYLDISNNSFTGEIPKNITELRSLIDREVSLEEPSPDFPLFMKRNVSARGFQYNQLESFPPTIDLGNNNLSGPLWLEFGNLKKLHVLDLKFNNLSGPIPSNWSGMASLETLDLSHNKLSGIIPPSLVKLSFLSKFNVADNQLHGQIPDGGQFPTFPTSSFEGNNLCGVGHDPPCKSDKQTPTQQLNKAKPSIGVIIGTAIGIVLGIALFLALIFIFVLRVHRRGEVDVEKEDGNTDDKDLEELGSSLVILFQNKEINGELSLDDLLKSTNNFDQGNIVGCGGFGLVYKATLPDGKKVAIKRLSSDCGQMDREFRAEVETLSRAQHPNLVHLQGYCTSCEENSRLAMDVISALNNQSSILTIGAFKLNWDPGVNTYLHNLVLRELIVLQHVLEKRIKLKHRNAYLKKL
ncbi:hypothetical protein FEM48_Zijuj10G0160400 [Ziziphus jujuba var. spinosa]|uniref:Protein kinase domain-containing protein n=1 Tax=Ziziphus jujuba var. spinosa TaxID=714518 RepID=A0A978UPC4_ZIZJJ|nr:hypothetical protein FEM48_Zijuj10G0160400 [Ziziphus jujuba var. spinosa]